MAKRLTITDISRISGVSRGTVDRILHNRGNVSEDSRTRVQKVLDEFNFKYNIHTSAVPFRKVLHLLICIPSYSPDDFWSQIRAGIYAAIEDYSDIETDFIDIDFDPFDGKSFLTSFYKALEGPVDGVILSQVFPRESKLACDELDARSIPYVFVNHVIPDTHPLAVFTVNQFASGHLAAYLLDSLSDRLAPVAVFFADRARGISSETLSRREGVEAYFQTAGRQSEVFFADIDISSDENFAESIASFISEHPDVKGIAVTNAHGAHVSDVLISLGHKDIVLISFDLTKENIAKLQSGHFSAVICQKPETQGYKATLGILQHFLYNRGAEKTICTQSLDVVFKDNLPWYKDLDR